MADKSFKLYSLLHVDLERVQKHVNMDKGVDNPIDVYINCGRLLAASCRYFNVSYAIVTNELDFVRDRVKFLGGGVDVVAGAFDRDVPIDAAFRSAHYKLDLLRSFGTGAFGEFVGLVDLDVVLTRSIDFITQADFSECLVVYDISNEECTSYGDTVIKSSLSALGADVSKGGYWFGGELILGGYKRFKELSAQIDRIWPLYGESYRNLHHVGDEMVVTAALGVLKQAGLQLVDAGKEFQGGNTLIARWWSTRTLCKQISFGAAEKAALLHLPADKPFLAEMAMLEFSPLTFLSSYRRYARKKLFTRRLLNPFLNFRAGRRYFVAGI